jgi:ribose transport system permease protein
LKAMERENRIMDIIGRLKKSSQSPEFPSIIILVTVVILNALLQKSFFAINVININLLTFTPLILISIGQAVIILCGGIDLSVGQQVSLINVILAVMMKNAGNNPAAVIPAMFVAFIVAMGMGFVNGFSAGYLNLPPMIATFGTAAIWFGIGLLILPSPGGLIPNWLISAFSWKFFLISTPLILIVLAYLFWILIKRRPLGRYIYAVGSNEPAAFANGVNTRRVKLLSYMLGSFFVLLGAFAITFQAGSGDARLGVAYTLTSIAAVVVGGIALKGGIGNVIGAVIGAIILNMVINLIYFANVPSEYQEFTKGAIIIFALALAVIYKRRQSRSLAT